MFHFRGSGRPCGRCWGIVIMIVGIVLMMLVVPRWAWAGILCACVIVAGFVIWRGSDACR